MSTKTVVDITPHPQILQVLGEIEFKPWQCVAELVDNSVDGFLRMFLAGTPIDDPTVQVAFGQDTVVVKDNGPGMAIDDLELAVKAGWTSNERFGSLGLYGIGFNIATARLGSVTTIWTTRAGDKTWYGLELDLKEIARGGKYFLDVKTRKKSDAKLSGTEVDVSRIKADWKERLINSGWLRNNITDRLARVYGTMLRDNDPQPIKFNLYINNKKVSAWEHCVWPADLDVYRKIEGIVRPIIEIDQIFGTKYLSRSTGEFHDSHEGLDEDDLLRVPERVYGWLGIQRYADENDFGVDILRNGRKIEIGCKDIFKWENEDGDAEIEYPIDDPRNRGRIVGEIHLDHGYVHYTKHRFEREHSSWKQLLLAVRSNEPLIKRKDQGYDGVNTSPLGILFRTFRRNSPLSKSGQKWRDILFISENQKAKEWAEKYRRGVTEFQNDELWLEELERADTPQPPAQEDTDDTDAGGESGPGEVELILEGGADQSTGEAQPREAAAQEPERIPMRDLSLRVSGIGLSGKTYEFEVYAIEPSPNTSFDFPWRTKPTARGVYEVEVNLRHSAFNSTSLQIRDAVLAEAAFIISSEETASLGAPRDEVRFANILVALRSRYPTTDSLDATQLRREISELRKRLVACLPRQLNYNEEVEILAGLPQEDVERIKLAQAQGVPSASLTDYFEMRHLAFVLEYKPALLLDTECFAGRWTPPTLAENTALLEAHRKKLTRNLWIPLTVLGEFSNPLALTSEPTRAYLALLRASINVISEYLEG